MKFAYPSGARPLDGYTIKRGVGVGGFGEVYYALSDAGKEVALKRIQRNLEVEVRGVSQCLNLKHPCLLALFDLRYDDHGEAWVIMEYVAGESLKERIDRHPEGLPLPEVRLWFQQIGAAVEYLHDQGIVHRDLKPGNIFIDQQGVKIGDYGLSKFISCSRRSGQTESVGTFHYMAPEIGKGIYGKEIDIYALGVILYEMLTGRLPFDGESGQEIIMKHLTADPDLTGLPWPYRGVVQRALFKDPAKRYGSIAELLRDLGLSSSEGPAAWVRPATAAAPEVITAEPVRGGDDGIVFGPVRNLRVPPMAPAARRLVAHASEEPIARAVRDGWHRGRHWWTHAQFSTTVKIVLLVVAAFALVVNSEWLVPLGVFMGAVYLVYFGVRSLVMALDATPAPGPAASVPAAVMPAAVMPAASVPAAAARVAPAPAPAQAAPRPVRRGGEQARKRLPWRQAARRELSHKPLSERFAELSGAMLMSALVSAVLCLVALIIGGRPLDDSIYTWSFYTWLACSSTFTAWTVLALGKFWEDREGEAIRRRFIMLLSGLLLGGAVCAFGDFLDVRLSDDLVVRSLPHVPASMYGADGTPRLPAYLLYFAGVFTLLRWWKQVDPLRTTRLSIMDTGLCVLVAWIVQMFVPFYQPWGFMLAAVTSIAVQLSAPWISGSDRERLQRQVHLAAERT